MHYSVLAEKAEGDPSSVTAVSLLDTEKEKFPKEVSIGHGARLVLRAVPKVIRCVRYSYDQDPDNYCRSINQMESIC